jgi:hypothetical protein
LAKVAKEAPLLLLAGAKAPTRATEAKRTSLDPSNFMVIVCVGCAESIMRTLRRKHEIPASLRGGK